MLVSSAYLIRALREILDTVLESRRCVPEKAIKGKQMEKLAAKKHEPPPTCFYHQAAAMPTNVEVCNSYAMYEAMQADIGRISVVGMSCIQVTTVV